MKKVISIILNRKAECLFTLLALIALSIRYDPVPRPDRAPDFIDPSGLKLWADLEYTRLAQQEMHLPRTVVYISENRYGARYRLTVYENRVLRQFANPDMTRQHLEAMAKQLGLR